MNVHIAAISYRWMGDMHLGEDPSAISSESCVPGDLAFTIAKGPLQIIVAIILGIMTGIFLWFFPNKKSVCTFVYLLFSLFIHLLV